MTPLLYNLIRPHFREMTGYVSAGMEAGKDETQIFMNANELPPILPELTGMNQYPEPQPPALISILADVYGVGTEQVLATRGADESIALLTKVFCEPHKDAVLIHPPTFGMYGVNAASMPARTIKVPLFKNEHGFSLNVQGMIEAAVDPENRVRIVYVCSPNNPTSGAFPEADILAVVKAVEGRAVVVLDEAYAEFSGKGSLSSHLAAHPNLLILRTLSKAYALAGERVGVTLSADPDFIALMRSKLLDAYPLPRSAIASALLALRPENRDKAKTAWAQALSERDRLCAHLKASPFVCRVYPSDANFFLVEVADAKGLWTYCREHGVVLRDFSSKAGTENCLRISPMRPDQNDRFLALFDVYTKNLADAGT